MNDEQRRFYDKTIQSQEGCWNWKLYKQGDGYGVVRYSRKVCLAHRVSLHLFKGFDLNSTLYVLHHCDNPSCVNPEHLYTGTQLDNMRDMCERGRARIGERHPKNKLREEDVLWMRANWGKDWSCAKLAKKFGINPRGAWDIVTHKTWRHV